MSKSDNFRRFAPVLRYLVEVNGMYTHPNHFGFVSGQEAWACPDLHFANYRDAFTYAKRKKGVVVKLRMSARKEAIRLKKVNSEPTP